MAATDSGGGPNRLAIYTIMKKIIRDQSEYIPILFLAMVTVMKKYTPATNIVLSIIIVPTKGFHNPNPTNGELLPINKGKSGR